MNIKQKITLGALILSVTPLLIVGAAISITAKNTGKEIVLETIKKNLISVNETKKSEITRYFEQIESQLLSHSHSNLIMNAAQDFTQAFRSLPSATPNMQSQLNDFYTQQFGQKYNTLNPSARLDFNRLMSPLSSRSLYLQYQYIAKNPNPLGSKELLDSAWDGTEYASVHAKYHPAIRFFLNRFEYYDIFIVNPNSGHIVYSVFKELDFATSLTTGPYKDSGIAKAFQEANQLTSNENVLLTDFEPYTPSYESPAAFIAAPIYTPESLLNRNFSKENKIGIIIYQMPIDRINNIMTSNQNWGHVGLGTTGQSLLIGADSTLRSENRLLIEDKQAYREYLAAEKVPADTINTVSRLESSIGRISLDNNLTSLALSGESGFSTFANTSGTQNIAAYSPIQLNGFNWAIITKMHESEAFNGIQALSQKVWGSTLVILISAVVIVTLTSNRFGGRLVLPLQAAALRMKDISEGDGDLTERLDLTSRDEIGDVAKYFNGFVGKIHNIMAGLVPNIESLKAGSDKLSYSSQQSFNQLQHQTSEIEAISQAVSQVVSQVEGVFNSADSVSNASNDAHQEAESAQAIFSKTISAMTDMTDRIEQTSVTINNLEEATKKIGSVLDVIRGIAEQTNLLALNAAIEAARAGEQGRGFAVVADEVRSLASRTQESTQEIEETISTLQSEAAAAVEVMNQSKDSAQVGIEEGQRAGNAIANVTKASETIRTMIDEVRSASENQLRMTQAISENLTNANHATNSVVNEFDGMNVSVEQLKTISTELERVVHQFKI